MKATGAGLLLLVANAPAAFAGSVTQPGETVGVAVGAPLPEGVYFVNTLDWGSRSTHPNSTRVGVNIPVLAWATPWYLLGGRVQLLIAQPALEVGVQHSNHQAGWYNTLLAGQLAWDLGGGFGISYLLGSYLRSDTNIAFDSTSLNQRLGLSYTGNDWNLTANIIYGINFNKASETINPDFLNVDLTATKKFGKFEIGPVAFGSTDLDRPIPGYRKQSQIAVGGLIGYDFGPVTLQGYVTRDVYQKNYGGFDTRVWGRVIIPLWTAPTAAAAAPVVTRKY